MINSNDVYSAKLKFQTSHKQKVNVFLDVGLTSL